ncbi:hypothetical protein [Candidatus Thiodictyon syntrophicum]|nr:hypothetical protein [Candidatus Thiodictyon syntrophicum]
MSPTPSTRNPNPAPAMGGRRRRVAAGWVTAAAVLCALTGCSAHTRDAVARQVHEIGCLSRCQSVKDRCDDDARYDYRQCEAGYQVAQRDFRWCNSSSEPECGYPWWSCSENLYGYCTNRFRECSDACRQPQRWATGSRPPRARGAAVRR